MVLTDVSLDDDALVPAPHPSVPLPQQPLALVGDLVVEAPRTTGSLIAVGKVATALGWQPSDLVSFRLFPVRRAVILRPADTLRDGSEQTVVGLDHGETWIDSKRRLRLPPGVLTSLGVRASGDQVLLWGHRRLGHRKPLGGKRPDGSTPWVVLLMHPMEAMPSAWDEWFEW